MSDRCQQARVEMHRRHAARDSGSPPGAVESETLIGEFRMPQRLSQTDRSRSLIAERIRRIGHVAGAALAHAPESAAYGLMAWAPLGAAFGPQAMGLALLSVVVANLVTDLFGAGRLVSGPRASMALLTAGLVAALVAHPGPHGPMSGQEVLGTLALCVAAAGLLQMLFGALRLGTIVKYTPHPVRTGLTSGVGLLLVFNALPVMMGHPIGDGWHTGAMIVSWPAFAVGSFAMACAVLATRLKVRWPPALVGLTAGTLLQAAWAHWGHPAGLSPNVGVPQLTWPVLSEGGWPPVDRLASPSFLGLLGSYVFTLATLATLDGLLAASVVDGRLHGFRDANRELRAQGLSNVAAGLLGGQPTSPSVPRSLALAHPASDSRHVVLSYAVVVTLALLLAPRLIGTIPVSAIGGVLVVQGWQMMAPSIWCTPWALARVAFVQVGGKDDLPRHDYERQRLLAENWGVTMLVVVTTMAYGLGSAVLVGAAAAVLQFVRSNMRDVVRRVRTGQTRRSLKMRTPEIARVLEEDGHRIAILELEGALFFGTADELRQRLGGIAETVDTAILDLHLVGDIDATGARILLETGDEWARRGKHLVAAEWAPDDARRRVVAAMATPGGVPGLTFARDTDAALEDAEQRLLERRRIQVDGTQVLALGDTQLGRGLSAAELAHLAALTETVKLKQGELLFRQGDPGDALYISLCGHIGLRLPGSERRLASFAPGVTMGEMAILDGRPRSAEAVAETDLVLLRLSDRAFEEMKSMQPALAAKLLHNIARHLADRVRTLTGELSGWVNRASIGRKGNHGPTLEVDSERERST
jgi:SulP family sulfate permease